MKPRLPIKLTPEDMEIYTLVVGRFAMAYGPYFAFFGSLHAADRRDADLMHRAVNWCWIVELNAIRPEPFHMWSDDGLQRIAFGGDLSADWYHEVQA